MSSGGTKCSVLQESQEVFFFKDKSIIIQLFRSYGTAFSFIFEKGTHVPPCNILSLWDIFFNNNLLYNILKDSFKAEIN